MWVDKKKVTQCLLCPTRFGLFTQGHHCRNCGFVICTSRSEKTWPSSMLRSFFHNNEKTVRVCNHCHCLVVLLVQALQLGYLASVKAIYDTGNVNLHQPFTIFVSAPYAVSRRNIIQQLLLVFMFISGAFGGDWW